MSDEDFLKPREAAAMLGIGYESLVHGRAGTIWLFHRRIKMGRLVRFLRSDVEEFKRQRIEDARRRAERSERILSLLKKRA